MPNKIKTIFDPVRQKHVILTPEEQVRCDFVTWIVKKRGFPLALLANEVQLQVGAKTLRADTVLYDSKLQPLMIIEYKAPGVAITQKTLVQISAYNTLLNVNYLVVTNGTQTYCFARRDGQWTQLPDIPTYQEITHNS